MQLTTQMALMQAQQEQTPSQGKRDQSETHSSRNKVPLTNPSAGETSKPTSDTTQEDLEQLMKNQIMDIVASKVKTLVVVEEARKECANRG